MDNQTNERRPEVRARYWLDGDRRSNVKSIISLRNTGTTIRTSVTTPCSTSRTCRCATPPALSRLHSSKPVHKNGSNWMRHFAGSMKVPTVSARIVKRRSPRPGFGRSPLHGDA